MFHLLFRSLLRHLQPGLSANIWAFVMSQVTLKLGLFTFTVTVLVMYEYYRITFKVSDTSPIDGIKSTEV